MLSLTFPNTLQLIGYGWATSAQNSGSTTIELFDALDFSLGTSTFIGAPDPGFIGGFAGILSTIPFLRAEVTFSPDRARFVFDNLRTAAAVPEPSTLGLIALGLLGLGGMICVGGDGTPLVRQLPL